MTVQNRAPRPTACLTRSGRRQSEVAVWTRKGQDDLALRILFQPGVRWIAL